MFELEERIKELQCLYGISKLVDRCETLDEIIQGVVQLIPQSWQFPDITRAKIILDDREYVCDDFRESRWSMRSIITISGDKAGLVEVFYIEKRPDIDEGPFLKEERALIDAIAERVGKVAERKRIIEKLLQVREELEIKTINLEEANTALKVLLNVKNDEKDELERHILDNIHLLILPYLEKITRESHDAMVINLVNIIEENLKAITSSFSHHFMGTHSGLSAKEIQIAHLIKDNKSSKEIASIMNVSEHAVFYYRKNIRKKLQLTHNKTNLRAYLQNLQSGIPDRTTAPDISK